MRKLGISLMGPDAETFRKNTRCAKAAGFETTFPGFSTYESCAQKCEILLEEGMEIDNTHSPFDGINNMWLPGEEGDTMLARQKQNIDCCAAFNIPKTVVHISSGWDAPQVNDLGLSRYDELVDYAIAKGVRVAFENLRKPGNLALLLERYEKVPEVGFCWDSGHELCYTPAWEYMPLYGDRTICIHLHDNIGILAGDEHMLPFDGKRDWEKTARYIKNSAYDGPIMLENWYRSEFYGKLTTEEFFARAYDAAFRIRDLIEQ